MRIAFITLFAMYGLCSCISSKGIKKELVARRTSMEYILTSEKKEKVVPKSVSVVVNSPSSSFMNELSTVRVKSKLVLPLVFVTYWDSKKRCDIGKDMIQEKDIDGFLLNGLKTEIERSGTFKLDSSNSNSEYVLNVSIDSASTYGPFSETHMVIFAVFAYAQSHSYYAGPGISTLKISYTLSKGSDIVMKNSFWANKGTVPISNRPNLNKLINEFGISLVEAFSLNYKQACQEIVKEINYEFSIH